MQVRPTLLPIYWLKTRSEFVFKFDFYIDCRELPFPNFLSPFLPTPSSLWISFHFSSSSRFALGFSPASVSLPFPFSQGFGNSPLSLSVCLPPYLRDYCTRSSEKCQLDFFSCVPVPGPPGCLLGSPGGSISGAKNLVCQENVVNMVTCVYCLSFMEVGETVTAHCIFSDR